MCAKLKVIISTLYTVKKITKVDIQLYKLLKSIFWILFGTTKFSTKFYLRRNVGRLEGWRERDFFFIHIPKTAGTSVCAYLGVTDPGHFTYREAESLGIVDNDTITFAVLRDPIDRLVSTFRYSKKVEKLNGSNALSWVSKFDSIDELVANGLSPERISEHYFLRPQAEYLPAKDNEKLALLDFQDLPDAVESYVKRVLPGRNALSEMPHLRASHSEKAEISAATARKIEELYIKDYELYKKIKNTA